MALDKMTVDKMSRRPNQSGSTVAPGDEGVQREADRLLLVVDRFRRPRVPADRREAPHRQLQQPLRQDQVLHRGVHQGRLQIRSGFIFAV